MDYQTSDFLKADFIKNYQALARQSWESMLNQLQKSPLNDDFITTVFPADSRASVTLENALSGLKGYAQWIRSAATIVRAPETDWQHQLDQLFGQGRQPFAPAFHGLDAGASLAIEGFARRWQGWLQSLQNDAASSGLFQGPLQGPLAAFGFGPEQLAEQQLLTAAVVEHLEASRRYQRLIQRSNERALETMRTRLGPFAEHTAQIDSLKILYDVWVECAEEAYAEIALSDEFREAFAAMVNSQMRVGELQQTQTEKRCRQMGMPTRSDVDGLAERLHTLRREMRATGSHSVSSGHVDEVGQLRLEVAELRTLLARRDATAVKKPAVDSVATATLSKLSAVKKAAARTRSPSSKATLVRAKSVPAKPLGKVDSRTSARTKK